MTTTTTTIDRVKEAAGSCGALQLLFACTRSVHVHSGVYVRVTMIRGRCEITDAGIQPRCNQL
jgi:hypothetical protein